MMLAAKGHSQTDGSYAYRCGKCQGTGRYAGQVCDWCYAGDFKAVREKLRAGVRGQQYYSLLKEFLRIAGKPLVTEARAFGRLSPVDVGYLSLRYGLNLKATWEWLEECEVVASGTYEDCIERGLKVKDIYARARETYPEIEIWEDE